MSGDLPVFSSQVQPTHLPIAIDYLAARVRWRWYRTNCRSTCRPEKAQSWEVTDRTVRTWIGEAVAAAAVSMQRSLTVGDTDDFLDCFIMPVHIVGGTFWG